MATQGDPDDERVCRHEKHAQEFLTAVRRLLIDAMKLSPETSPEIFARVNGLTGTLRELFYENTDEAERKLKQRLRDRFDKFIKEL